MSKIRYCKVQNCDYFTGTSNKEIRMFMLVEYQNKNFLFEFI